MTCLRLLILLMAILIFGGCDSDDGGGAAPTPTSAPSSTATATRTNTTLLPPATASPTRSATASPTTANASSTPTATPTASPTRTGTHLDGCCGDRIVEAVRGETCDDGNNVGGDGCAANCTVEREGMLMLMGQSVAQTGLFALEINLASEQTVRLGQPTGAASTLSCGGTVQFAMGDIPLTQRVADLQFDPAAVPGLVCACLRPIAIERCGPPLINSQPPSCDVGADCSGDAAVCGEPALCRAAHGPGNAGSGVIGCSGMTDIDYDVTTDDVAKTTHCVRSGGEAPAGSAFLFTTVAIGTIMDSGTCSVDSSDPRKGGDGIPCTDDDPAESRGIPGTMALTTGTVNGGIIGPFPIQQGGICGSFPCMTFATGRAFSCAALAQDPPSSGDFRLCSASATVDQPTVGDSVIVTCFETAP